MSDLDDAIERLNPDASPQYLYRGPSNTVDVEDDLRLLIAAARERDALAAVIEEARAACRIPLAVTVAGSSMAEAAAAGTAAGIDRILSRTPSDVLAERDARVRAEVIDWIADGDSTPSIRRSVKNARGHFGIDVFTRREQTNGE